MIEPIGFDETDDEYTVRLEAEIERLQRRVTVLEMVIAQEMPAWNCQDDLNQMIVDDICNRPSDAVSTQKEPS